MEESKYIARDQEERVETVGFPYGTFSKKELQDLKNLLERKFPLLLDKDNQLIFTPINMMMNLQESGKYVISNFNDKRFTFFLFIQSDYFNDAKYHLDFHRVVNFDGKPLSYKSAYRGVAIKTYGLRVFLRSGDLDSVFHGFASFRDDSEKNFFYNGASGAEQMNYLRKKGFTEFELCEDQDGQKFFRVVDNDEQKNIDNQWMWKFLKMNIHRDGRDIVEFYEKCVNIPEEELRKKWEELRKKSAIIKATDEKQNPKDVYLKIDTQSFCCFVRSNLLHFCNAYKITIDLQINNVYYADYAQIFKNALNGENKNEIVIKYNGGELNRQFRTNDLDIRQLYFEIREHCNVKNEKSECEQKYESLELILRLDENQKLCFYYGNRKTDIKITVCEPDKNEMLVSDSKIKSLKSCGFDYIPKQSQTNKQIHK